MTDIHISLQMTSHECQKTPNCSCAECQLEAMPPPPPRQRRPAAEILAELEQKRAFPKTANEKHTLSELRQQPTEPEQPHRPPPLEVLKELEQKRTFPKQPPPPPEPEPLPGMVGSDGHFRVGLKKMKTGREEIDVEQLTEEMEKELDDVTYSMEALMMMNTDELRKELRDRFLRSSAIPCKPGQSYVNKAEMAQRIYNFDHDIPMDPRILKRGNRKSILEAEGRFAWNGGYRPTQGKGIRVRPIKRCYKKNPVQPNKPGNLRPYAHRRHVVPSDDV